MGMPNLAIQWTREEVLALPNNDNRHDTALATPDWRLPIWTSAPARLSSPISSWFP